MAYFDKHELWFVDRNVPLYNGRLRFDQPFAVTTYDDGIFVEETAGADQYIDAARSTLSSVGKTPSATMTTSEVPGSSGILRRRLGA